MSVVNLSGGRLDELTSFQNPLKRESFNAIWSS